MKQDDEIDFYKSGSPDESGSDGRSPSSGRGPRHSANRTMSWRAPEYVEFERGSDWYLGLASITIVLAGGIYFLTKDYFAAGSIVAASLILGFYVGRKPQNIDYELSDSGLEVGRRNYAYGAFKSFTVVRDQGVSSVELMPLKRFNLPVSACFAPEDEKKVVEIIGEHLPYVEHNPGLFERISQRLRL